MTDPTPSPAQKILAAFNDRHELCGPFDDNWVELCLAAAFREFANEVVPTTPPPKFAAHYEEGIWDGKDDVKDQLLAIAAELEAQP
jgi:hypothetical protein